MASVDEVQYDKIDQRIDYLCRRVDDLYCKVYGSKDAVNDGATREQSSQSLETTRFKSHGHTYELRVEKECIGGGLAPDYEETPNVYYDGKRIARYSTTLIAFDTPHTDEEAKWYMHGLIGAYNYITNYGKHPERYTHG